MKGLALWFTGLPCSGKTTLAEALCDKLATEGLPVTHLDGDVLRRSLSKDLGFSKTDRLTHIARVAALTAELVSQGNIVLVSLVSPYRAARQNARRAIGSFAEVYVRCPLGVCEERDVKGMYRSARQGKIASFTGVSDIYEAPENPEIVVDTHVLGVKESVESLLDGLVEIMPTRRRRAHGGPSRRAAA